MTRPTLAERVAGQSPVPDFSIVIPTRDRTAELAQCLSCLRALEAGPTFEVIVIDDGGREPMGEWPDADGHLKLVVIRQPRAGPAAARNAGLRLAQGRWIIFTDDDCLPEPQWLRAFAGAVAQWPDRGVGGPVIDAAKPSLYSSAHEVLVAYVTRRWQDARGPRFFPSNNLLFPADALREIGGFDETFPFAAGEDRELCDRWVRAGHQLAEWPHAVVRHAHRVHLTRFCGMHYRYGRGARRFHRQVAVREGRPVRLERAAFYAGLVAAPFAAGAGVRAPILSALLVLSQCCHVAGYAREVWAERAARHAHRAANERSANI